MKTTPEKIAIILDDASYLIDEMEALSFVIKVIPVTERPAGTYSVLEFIASIDYAQIAFYRKAAQLFLSETTFFIPHHKSSFKPDTISNDVSIVLSELKKNRIEFVDFLKSVPEKQWEVLFTLNNQEYSLFELLTEMIQNERSILREIAERVLAIDQSKANQKGV
jgi:hypothetical protein